MTLKFLGKRKVEWMVPSFWRTRIYEDHKEWNSINLSVKKQRQHKALKRDQYHTQFNINELEIYVVNIADKFYPWDGVGISLFGTGISLLVKWSPVLDHIPKQTLLVDRLSSLAIFHSFWKR